MKMRGYTHCGMPRVEARPVTLAKARLIVLALALTLLAAAQAANPVRAQANEFTPPAFRFETQVRVSRLDVVVDKSETLRLDQPFVDVLVGNSDVADVMPLTDRTLYVLGKRVGTTRVTVLDGQRRVARVVEVQVGYDMAEIQAALDENLPASRVSVRLLGGSILLAGSVPDSMALQRAVAIAEQFAPGAVTNSLTVESPQQVLLEVRFVEASRTAGRDLGINWMAHSRIPGKFSGATGNATGTHRLARVEADGTRIFEGTPLFSLAGGLAAAGLAGGFPSGATPFGTFIARVISGGVSVDGLIQALEEQGLARRLAEPNLVALSGDSASFLAGGEFPFPVPGSRDEAPSVQFKEFGVGLGFTPTVLANGMINLKIVPEVSELDFANSVSVAGTAVPGLVTRRASTTVELRDGQSFAIAGLLQTNHSKAQRQLPWLGQVPVLGALFRSASYEKRETDLVIIVTPRLVQPRGPEHQLITPFDKSVASNDVDFFLHGKQEVWNTRVVAAKKPGKAPPLPKYGHLLEITKLEPAAREHRQWK